MASSVSRSLQSCAVAAATAVGVFAVIKPSNSSENQKTSMLLLALLKEKRKAEEALRERKQFQERMELKRAKIALMMIMKMNTKAHGGLGWNLTG